MEAAAKDTLQMTVQPPSTTVGSDEVHQMETRQTTRKQGAVGRAYYRCGSPTHLAPACRHLETVCKSCGKKGHLANVCRSKSWKPQSTQQAKYINEFENVEPDDQATVLTIANPRTLPIKARLTLAGEEVAVEVDTGASVSLMPIE